MQPPLREIGFFAELRHGRPDGPRLKEAVRPGSREHEADLIGYLRSASVLAVNGLAIDALSGESLGESLSILTDGVWMWPSDLAFYVERYHVELPGEFAVHAAAQSWSAPLLSQEKLVALAKLRRG